MAVMEELKFKKSIEHIEKNSKTEDMNLTWSLIILNINGLNYPIKGRDWQMEKEHNMIHLCIVYNSNTSFKGTKYWKYNDGKYNPCKNQKRTRVPIQISNKIDFKTRDTSRDEGIL